MCGIAGIIELDGRPIDRGLLSAMTDALGHRGPDGDGFFIQDGEPGFPSCGLGHRRLSIIDLRPSVRHPLANEDGSVRVMVNGEFYGYQKIRTELERKGHLFTTDCDSEILVHLYEEEGLEAISRMRGMFALALWDGSLGRLVLARDRLGQKPLYWTRIGQRILFASEVKALMADPGFERKLNKEVLARYLSWLYLPGQESWLMGVRRLPPGHLALIGPEEIQGKRYWSLDPAPEEMSEAEAQEGFERLLNEAVGLRLVSDAPLGAFLSGGIDSSVICALMSEQMAGSGNRPRTFTVRFGSSTFDESAKAARVAAHLGTDHTEVFVEPDLLDDLDDLIGFLDEPMADSSAIPTYWLCKATREHVTVALSGDAGDELLAGYRRYVGRRLAERYNRFTPGPLRGLIRLGAGLLPTSSDYEGRSFTKKLKKFLAQAAQVEAAPDSSRIDFLEAARLAELLGKGAGDPAAVPEYFAALFKKAPEGDSVARMQWVDLMTYLPDDILVKVDRMSMAHALEVRSPFLDHHLVEFLAKVPLEFKLRGLTTKYLLKKTALKYLPRDIVNQPKQGFEVPLADWFRGDLKGLLRNVLGRGELERAGLIRPGGSMDLVRAHLSGKEDLAQVLWGLLILELWIRKFKINIG